MPDFPASLARALRFWSRLPVPAPRDDTDPHAPPDMARLAPAAPLAGALIGLVGALVLGVSDALGLPAGVSAVLATAALVAATGAMHEDALADIADGFGGGRTRDAKLAIMKDPRLGAYGASALMLALALRVALFAGLLAGLGPWRAGAAIVAAAALARVAGLWPLAALPPARADGIGAVAAPLGRPAWTRGALVAIAVAFAAGLPVAGFAGAALAPLGGLGVAVLVARLAERQIGGQTGDVCGAATILAELAVLTALLASQPN